MSRRRHRWLGAFGILVAVAALRPLHAGEGEVRVLAIRNPSEAILRALAARPDVDVRWVEQGLVVCETAPEVPLPQGAELVAKRPPDLDLGILRGREVRHWSELAKSAAPAGRFLARARAARVPADAGEVWVLLAAPGTWPSELSGCHGGLVVCGHRLDPRSLVDAGPPPGLAAAAARAGRAFTPAERAVLTSVSMDSLGARLQELALAPGGAPADRYVFDADLDGLYAGRVVSAMERALAGIAGTSVERQPVPMRRTGAPTDTTYNLVARLPGTVPGTGTFVVGAHVDATGSRDTPWSDAVLRGDRVTTPGAEDNASGVSCVLELLRCAADGVRSGTLQLAFDVEFIAWSGEERPVVGVSPEVGLVGSKVYVRAQVARGTRPLGNLNFDMVGYDSIPARPWNLQVVHNAGSRWLATFVDEAVGALVPPTPLVLQVQRDEEPASDHSSFWDQAIPAVLFADADLDELRGYGSYHRPVDTIERVSLNKLYEVTRAGLGVLLQLDPRTQTAPSLVFGSEQVRLVRTVGGQDYTYRSSHRLWPGAPFKASLGIHSTGAPYAGSVHLQVDVTNAAGTRTLLDSLPAVNVPTGGRLAVVVPIAIQPQDVGSNRLTARVTWTDSAGADVVQTGVDSFRVDAAQQSVRINLTANPVRGGLSQAQLVIPDLTRIGELHVEVFDLEGERVYGGTRTVFPSDLLTGGTRARDKKVPLITEGGTAVPSLPSGTYVVRLRWQGAEGESYSGTTPLVLLR